jgi:hypothetical protein
MMKVIYFGQKLIFYDCNESINELLNLFPKLVIYTDTTDVQAQDIYFFFKLPANLFWTLGA